MMSQPNLVLIGFMGTGKSTIGRECAEKLGFAFRDTDACIERRAERSIPEIFEHQGDTFPHHAFSVDGVHQGLCRRFEKIAFSNFNHGKYQPRCIVTWGRWAKLATRFAIRSATS